MCCMKWNGKQTKKYETVGTVLKSKRKITERNKIDSPNTFTWPLTFLSWYRNFNKKWRGKTRLKTQISPLTDMMGPWKFFFPHVSLLQTLTHDRVNNIVLKNALILNILHSMFELTMVIVQTLISTLPLNV